MSKEENKVSVKTDRNLVVTVGAVLLMFVALSIQSFYYTKNLAQKDETDDIKSSVDNLEKKIGSLQTNDERIVYDRMIGNYINDYIQAQLYGGYLPYSGSSSRADDGSTIYQNQNIGLEAIVAPQSLIMNTVYIDYKVTQDRPKGLFLSMSNQLDFAMSAQIPEGNIEGNILVLGFVYTDKASFENVFNQYKNPIDERAVSESVQTMNNVNFNAVYQSSEDKAKGDIKIIAPDYSSYNDEEYDGNYMLFYLGGDLENYQPTISTIENSILLQMPEKKES